jgi:hypothetical protein
MTFRVDGRRRSSDRRAPFVFTWNAARAKPGRHVLEVVAVSVDGREATRRIPVVVPQRAPKPKPRPKPPKPPTPPAAPALRIVSQSVADGQMATGLVVWRVEAVAAARVEFVVDGVLRGTDVAAPYTLGWSAAAETPGAHRLTARAVGTGGKTVEATVSVTVPAETGSGGP